MELIRKIESRKDKDGKLRKWAVFLCNFCLEEVERRLSYGLKAKSCGCVQYILMANTNKGSKRTEQTKNILREKKSKNLTFLGKKHTKEHKEYMSNLMKEKFSDPRNHPNWQDGISFEEYPQEFNKELKQIILERDNYTCQDIYCKHLSKRLHVHHIDYDKKNNNVENLITLCASCHCKTNYNRTFWKQYYRDFLGDYL